MRDDKSVLPQREFQQHVEMLTADNNVLDYAKTNKNPYNI